MADKKVYRVMFHNAGQIYEVYAHKVSQSGLLGFVEVSGLIFGEKTQLVVDPGEEKLKAEFEGVECCYLPMQAVVRIDQVAKQGPCKIHADSTGNTNVTRFPSPILTPRKSGD